MNPKQSMTITKAKKILKQLDRLIAKIEDEAIETWDKPETLKSEHLHDELVHRYTCRRALRNWLARKEQ